MIGYFATEVEKMARVKGAKGRRAAPGAAAGVSKVRGEPGSAVMSPGSGRAILGAKWSIKKLKGLKKRAPQWGY